MGHRAQSVQCPSHWSPVPCRDRAGGNSRDTGSLVHCSLGVATMWGAEAGCPRQWGATSSLWARGDVALAGRALSDLCIATAGSTRIIPIATYPHSYGLTTVLQSWRGSQLPWIRHYSHPVRAQCPNKDIPALQPVMPGAKRLQPLLPTSCQLLCSMSEQHQLHSSHHRVAALTESQRLLPFLPSTPSHIPSATPWLCKEECDPAQPRDPTALPQTEPQQPLETSSIRL